MPTAPRPYLKCNFVFLIIILLQENEVTKLHVSIMSGKNFMLTKNNPEETLEEFMNILKKDAVYARG